MLKVSYTNRYMELCFIFLLLNKLTRKSLKSIIKIIHILNHLYVLY